MVSNPMQKKARNSFLLGVVITLIICLLIGALFYVLVIRKEQAKQKEEGVLTYVYRLNTDVQSGEEIDSTKVESILITSKVIPEGSAFASRTKIKDAKGKEQWVETAFPVGYKSKVNLKAGTILSTELLFQEEEITNDLRYIEYNMLALPTTIAIGDYIDIRLTLPNGQDLIVISKKEVKSLLGDTVGLELSEGEILMMESAIVEAYIMSASKLYAIQYVEPGMQEAATKTYTPTTAVQGLIERNTNIVTEAKNGLMNKFNADIRTWTDTEVNNYASDKQGNIEAGLKEEVENAKAAREAYLSGLTSY